MPIRNCLLTGRAMEAFCTSSVWGGGGQKEATGKKRHLRARARAGHAHKFFFNVSTVEHSNWKILSRSVDRPRSTSMLLSASTIIIHGLTISQFRSNQTYPTMFKLAALSALVAGAAAFAPAQQGASSTALMAFESEVCTSSPRYFLFGAEPRLE